MEFKASVLFDGKARGIAFSAVLERVNHGLRELGTTLEATAWGNSTEALFSHPDFHISITVSDRPEAADIFAKALAAPITRIRSFDFAAAVAAHKSHIRVDVGDGPVPKPDDIRAMEEEMGMVHDARSAPATVKIMALHQATLAILGTQKPSAIFWQQSGMFFTPDAFAKTAYQKFPSGLVFHPTLFSSGHDGDGKRKIGFVALHSHLFCGQTLVMTENTLGLTSATDILAHVLKQKLAGTAALEDGEVIRFDELIEVHIRNDATYGDTHSRIYLTPVMVSDGPYLLTTPAASRQAGAEEEAQSRITPRKAGSSAGDDDEMSPYAWHFLTSTNTEAARNILLDPRSMWLFAIALAAFITPFLSLSLLALMFLPTRFRIAAIHNLTLVTISGMAILPALIT